MTLLHQLRRQTMLHAGLSQGLVVLLSIALHAQLPPQDQHGIEKSTQPNANSTSVLANDPRLKRHITLRRDRVTVEQATAELTARTGVSCAAAGVELCQTPISVFLKQVTASDAMDSIASLGLWEWQKSNETWILRLQYDPRALDAHRPHTEHQADIYRYGKQFLDQFLNLSPQDQNALGYDNSSQNSNDHPGVNFGALPENMQNSVRNILGARLADVATRGGSPLNLIADGLSSSAVRLQAHSPQDGFQSYDVDISNGTSCVSSSFVIFADPREGNEVVPTSDLVPARFFDEKSEAASRLHALTNDPRLSMRITLSAKHATFLEALHELALKSGISIAARASSDKPEATRKDVSLLNVPVKDAIAQLTSVYGFSVHNQQFHYTWGMRSSGILVFHIALDSTVVQEPK